MKDFYQWLETTHNLDEKGFYEWLGITNLNEKEARTELGPYTDSYGAGRYPPAYHMSRDAGALRKLKTWHPNVLKNTNPKPKKN